VIGFFRVTVSRTKLVGIALGIAAVTIWLYWPSVHGGFLNGMDDDEELQQSVRLNGLTWNAVKWAFAATEPDYYPLQRLTHFLDYQIWGKNAAGHHATSVILHALNAGLVFGFLWTLLGAASLTTGERLAMALGVATVFAIHPFQTEPAARISCRTHLLCSTFGIGCLWAYVAGARRWTVCGLYVGALLSSPMAVSFPFVMLAIDYFPLRRHEQLGWGRLVRERVVLIGLSGVVAAVTMITESRTGGMMVTAGAVPLLNRVLLMFQSLAFYPWRLLCPMHLLPFYPLGLGLVLNRWWVPVIGVVIVTALAVWGRSRLPALVAAWGAYLVLVLPASGLMQRGPQAVALRYAYLAMLPLLLLVGGAVIWVWRRYATLARVALACLLVGELCSFGLRTRSQIPVWGNDETLWRAVLVQFPNSGMANRMLAATLLLQSRLREAVEYGQRAVRIEPEVAEAQINLGVALFLTGQPEEAIGHLQQAVRIKPDSAEAHYNLGLALGQLGKVREAIAHYEEALRIDPDLVEAHYNLGVALEKAGRVPEAMQHYQQALKLRPDITAARDALARLRAGQ
jgi:cytochrome c-type biogenesis protein CcmH/NrfG